MANKRVNRVRKKIRLGNIFEMVNQGKASGEFYMLSQVSIRGYAFVCVNDGRLWDVGVDIEDIYDVSTDEMDNLAGDVPGVKFVKVFESVDGYIKYNTIWAPCPTGGGGDQ